MPGKEIKGRSKIATYSHGGRIGLKRGGGISETSKKQSLELREKKRQKRWEKEYKKGGRVKLNAGGYIGKSIKGEYGGVNLSNPSYKKYYKGLV